MTQANIPKFTFYRTNEVTEHNGVIGNRGILRVNDKVFVTIERDIKNYVDIPIGTYTLKMEISANYKEKVRFYPIPTEISLPRRQFRIMGHNVPGKSGLANLLIHRGKYPGGLTGCIAPGKMTIPGGVDQSDLAMQELFNACGGFQVKEAAAILEVTDKPSLYMPIPTF